MHSNELDKIMPSLAKAQGLYPKVEKTKTGHYGKFANMLDIMESVREPNRQCGLFIYHVLLTEDGTLYSESRICHWESQQHVAARMPLDTELSAQALGSAITYAQKYCTKGLVGIQADEDNDGQSADDEQRTRRNARSSARKPKPRTSAKEEKGDKEISVLQKWHANLRAVMTQGEIVTEPAEQAKILKEMVGAAGYESSRELSAKERNEMMLEVRRLYGPPMGDAES